MSYTLVYNRPGYLPEMEPYQIEDNLAEALNAVYSEIDSMSFEDDPEGLDTRWLSLLEEVERDRDNAANLDESGCLYSMPNGYVIEVVLNN